MKIQLVLFAIVFVVASGEPGEPDPPLYCGRRLADMLAALCFTKYEKRSGYNSLQLGYEPEFNWPWLAPRGGLAHRGLGDRALSTRDMGARGKRGIIEECCTRACSVSTLMSYC